MKELDYLKYSEQILKELRKISLFEKLDNSSAHALASLCKFREFQRGEYIIKEEEYDHWMYFLLSGAVVIQKKGKTISKLQRIGDLFGEVGIIDGFPRSASVISDTEGTSCILVDASILDRLENEGKMAVVGHIFRMIAEAIASKLRTTNEEVIKLREDNKALINKLRKYE